jgi:hypothetical protein
MRVVTERREIAQTLNFGKYPVLTYDLDADKGSEAIVTKQSRNYGLQRHKCELCKGDGKFYLMTHAAMISSSFGTRDVLEMAAYANAPVIESHQDVAIVVHSKKKNSFGVFVVTAGKADPTYSTAVDFS